MGQNNKFLTLALVVVIGVALQGLLVWADCRNTPYRAAVDFSKAYFKLDSSMADLLCEESRVVDDVDVVEQYIDQTIADVKMRGFGEIYIYNMNSKNTEKLQPLARWCCYLGFRWSPDGDYFLFAFQDIQYNNPPQFYNVIYGTIGSGINPDPLTLPEQTLTGENPHPVFRSAP